MNEVTTTQGRIDLAKVRAGEIPIPKITHIALGTGGHQPGDPTKPVPPLPTRLPLKVRFYESPLPLSEPIT